MAEVDVLFLRADSPTITPLVEELERRGLTVHRRTIEDPPHGTHDHPLIVLITPAMVAAVGRADLEAIASAYSEVLPVSYLDGPAPFFRNLTHSLITSLGTDEAARRIVPVARFGGARLVAWNRFVDRAVNRRQEPSAQDLLNSEQIDEASVLLSAAEEMHLSTHTGAVRELIAASRAAVQRRRRRWAGLLSCTALALIAVLVFAIVQAVSAQHSRAHAHRADASATADRLGRAATDLVYSDPDMPAILLNDAADEAGERATLDYANSVDARTWPHSSYALDYTPGRIASASGSDRIVISEAGDTVLHIYDSPGGEEIRTYDYYSGGRVSTAVFTLSPAGDRLAMRYAEPASLQIIDIAGNAGTDGSAAAGRPAVAESWRSPGDTPLTWLDEDHLLVARRNTVISVDVVTGELRTVLTYPDGGTGRAAKQSPGGGFVAVAGRDRIDVVDTSTLHTVATIDEPRVTDLAVDDSGRFVTAAKWPQAIAFTADRPGSGAFSGSPLPMTAVSVEQIDDTVSVIGGDKGRLGLVVKGMPGLTMTVRAHLSDKVRMAPLPDRRIATVDYDGYLRVWQVPGAARIGTPGPLGFTGSETDADVVGVAHTEVMSAHSQIRLTPDDRLLATVVPGQVIVVDPDRIGGDDRLDPYFRQWFGLNAELALSDDGGAAAVTDAQGDSAIRTGILDQGTGGLAPGTPLEGTTLPASTSALGTGILAVGDDAASAIMADLHKVAYWHEGGPMRSSSFTDEARPIALYCDDAGHGVALTSAGTVRDFGGDQHAVTGWDADARPLAAAAFDSVDDFYAVTGDGTLLHGDDGTVTPSGAVGANLDPFAVRISGSGRYVAVLGKKGMAVVDIRQGTLILTEPSVGDVYVTDVAFARDDTSMYAVTGAGSFRTVRIPDEPEPDTAPRAPTATESSLYSLDTERSDG